MKQFLKLAGFVLVGLAAAIVLYWPSANWVVEALCSRSGRSPESYLGLAFLIILPISLFLGSLITGYLASQYVKGTVGLIWIAPGLYWTLAVVPRCFVGTIPGFGVTMLFFGIVWTCVSWGGVAVGRRIRMKRRAREQC
jgi:hypothetical protein